MIFSLKQGMYTAVLLGDKTLTTRLKLPAHIAKGKEWAIVPGRAKPAWWIGSHEILVKNALYSMLSTYTMPFDGRNLKTLPQIAHWCGYVRAAIHIETFYEVSLQDMTLSEALREGVGSVDEYAALWDRINDKKGVRWADNPHVYRISFHLPDDVYQAVSRVGRAAILEAAGMTPELEKVSS